MKSHTEKTQDNKSRAAANDISQKQGDRDSAFRFLDNRPGAIAQRKLQNLANNSPQVMKMKAFQKMASKHALTVKIGKESGGNDVSNNRMVTSIAKIQERGEVLNLTDLPREPAQLYTRAIQRGTGGSKGDEGAVFQEEYKKKVMEAINAMKGHIGFGASPRGEFDKDHWKQIEDKRYGLAIEATSKPSVAIKAMMAKPDKWSFDCAEYVQVCNLYATMKMYGKGSIDKKTLVLRQHGSTPFEASGITFERMNAGKKFDAIFPRKNNAVAENFIDEDTLLAGIPPGSRITFKNPAGEGTPFRNENAVAEGGGKYSAHPLGSGLSAEDIINGLVMHNQRDNRGGDEGGRSEIFLSQVEIYASIPLGKATVEALGLSEAQKLM